MKLFREYIYPRLILDIATFFVPLMIGGIVAARLSITSVEVWLGIIANFLMLAFAFIYNDIEDAEDDAAYEFEKVSVLNHLKMNLGFYEQAKGKRRFRNPFSDGSMTKQQGFNILLSIIIVSVIASFLVGGVLGMFIALSNLVIGILYSGGIVRFKAHVLIDVLSHSYLLSGVQILYFFVYNNAQVDILSWLLLLGGMIYSISGDLWNEYRDFGADQAAGLKNTAQTLGKKKTFIICKIMAPLSIMFTIAMGVLILVSY